MDRRAAAAQFEQTLGHTFADRSLLERALTHVSVLQRERGRPHNEALEFLGDRVLGLLAAEALLRLGPEWREGELNRRFVALVNGGICAQVAKALGLGAALRLAGATTHQGGRENDRILGDALEAVLAAVYLDGGLDAARTVFERLWGALLTACAADDRRDPKTALQEWAQARSLAPPAYVATGRTGPDHAPIFTVEVRVSDLAAEVAEGPSLRAAEKTAATLLLSRLITGEA